MAEREARFVLLDVLSGDRETLTIRPGERLQHERLQIHVQACEKRPPWQPPEAAAFVQVDEQADDPAAAPARLFSGWMLARARSVNPFEHSRYELWLTDCMMTWPATGPDTVVID